MMDFRCIADLQAEVLESPLWDSRRGTLFCCDIPGCELLEVSPSIGILRRWTFGSSVVSLGLCESGRLVVALAREVIHFDPETGAKSALFAAKDEPATSRLNDGKVGADGCFWVGSMDMRSPPRPSSRLYRIDAKGGARIEAEGFIVSNGLAWSPDGRRMYHSDSRGPWIDSYAFDQGSGNLSDRMRFRELTDAEGRPDGGACDSEGNYWSAGVSAGVLNRFSPDGMLCEIIRLPVPAPTMPCFCGPDLNQIAVTSHRMISSEGLLGAPFSGGLFLAEAPVPGAPVMRMKGC